MKCSGSACFHCSGWIAIAFSPSGFGSRWLNWENSISVSELDSLSWAKVGAADKIDIVTIDNQRMAADEANSVRDWSKPVTVGVRNCECILPVGVSVRSW